MVTFGKFQFQMSCKLNLFYIKLFKNKINMINFVIYKHKIVKNILLIIYVDHKAYRLGKIWLNSFLHLILHSLHLPYISSFYFDEQCFHSFVLRAVQIHSKLYVICLFVEHYSNINEVIIAIIICKFIFFYILALI